MPVNHILVCCSDYTIYIIPAKLEQLILGVNFRCPVKSDFLAHHTGNMQMQHYCEVIHFSKITNISENIKSSNGLETYPFWVGRHDANIWLLQHIVREVGRHNEKVSACNLCENNF